MNNVFKLIFKIALTLGMLSGCSLHTSIKSLDGQASVEATSPSTPVTSPIVEAPKSLVLTDPPVPAGSVATPTIKVAGVQAGDTVKIYTDSSCTQMVGSGTASGEEIDLTTSTNLGVGAYNFYANISRGNSGASSCSQAIAQYLYDPTNSVISLGKVFQRFSEASGLQTVTVNMSPAKPYDVTVTYSLENSSAIQGVHYDTLSRSVTIPAGQTSADISFNVLENSATSGEKKIQINLSSTSLSRTSFGKQISSRAFFTDNDSTYISAKQMSGGERMFCAISSQDALSCWGSNTYAGTGYGLGNGTSTSDVPVTVDSGVSYASVSVGRNHACAITLGGVLKCWGRNVAGAIGNNTTATQQTPIVIDSGTSYLKVSAGGLHTCGITTANVLKCWGYNSYYQIGDGTLATQLLPIIINGGTTYKDVAAGGAHTCAVTLAGVMKCWGGNSAGQLGNGNTATQSAITVIDAGTSYLNVVATTRDMFWDHTCGLTLGNKIKCWGTQYSGALGNGVDSSSPLSTPTLIDSAVDYKAVFVSDYNTCGINLADEVKCAGLLIPQILDTSTDHTLMNFVDPNNLYSSFPQASFKFCGILKTSGVIKCFDDTISESLSPVAIDSESIYTSISARGNHLCGITSSGEFRCAGGGTGGQIGDGTLYTRATFVTLNKGKTYSQVQVSNSASYSIGLARTCGIESTGALICGGLGIIGNGNSYGSGSPISFLTIDKGTSYSEISHSEEATCGITTSGVLKCWGYNINGYVGDGTTTDRFSPTIIDPGTTYKKVSVGVQSSCAITSQGALKCWGYNQYGDVGDGTTTKRLSPIVIDSGTSYTDISAGEIYTCGITVSGSVKCWGDNYYGQLGDGSTTDRLTPTPVDAGVSYRAISTSIQTTCGITTSNQLKCWGKSPGDGSASSLTPVLVDAGNSYKSVSGGLLGTCGIMTSGKLMCWGNTSGLSGMMATTPWTEISLGSDTP